LRSRVSLLVLALALCAGISIALLRRGEPSASAPAPRASSPSPAVPAAAPPAARPRSKPISRDPEPSSARAGILLRQRLGEEYEKARESGSAYSWLKSRIDGRPATESERRERVYAFRLLPAAAADEPARREEVLALLRGHLVSDEDGDARLACAAAMGGAALHLHDDGKYSWFWVGELLEPGPAEPGRRTLDVPLRGELRAAYAGEADVLNRLTLVQLLAEKPAPGEADFFRSVLQDDRDPGSREYAAVALGGLPASPESLAALRRAMDGDADPVPRRKALGALVMLGAVDDLVAARLIASAPADPQGWELLGRAWAIAKPPPIGAWLRQSLESSDLALRAGALQSIAASGDKSFVPFVEAARAKEPDASLRRLGDETIQALSGSR
jgi:hypothetical protein